MKLMIVLIAALSMIACATQQERLIQSAETEIVNTLTNNGCLIAKYHHQSKVGVVDVECK